VKVVATTKTTHNPLNETHWVSCLRENLTSSSDGEGLETGCALSSVPRQSFTRQPLHERIQQFLGAEDSQLQTETGVRRHLTLVFVVNSLLKSLDLSQPIGDLPMTEFQDVSPTFGQRCRRILFEVFHDLIQTLARWLEERQMTPGEIFETLFKRMLYA
jgi:hypothetical protein